MHFTLLKPGTPLTETVYNIDFAGDGIVLTAIGAGSPKPTYYSTNQEAKEGMIRDAYELLQNGYRFYTGDGVTE